MCSSAVSGAATQVWHARACVHASGAACNAGAGCQIVAGCCSPRRRGRGKRHGPRANSEAQGPASGACGREPPGEGGQYTRRAVDLLVTVFNTPGAL